MRRLNLLCVRSADGKRVLVCRRRKPPFAGLLNFPGGKAEPGETGAQAAYRELREETGLTEADITLQHIMDLTYYPEDMVLEVYTGCLIAERAVCGDENPLLWVSADEDFFDVTRFAGYGNLGHIMAHIVQNGL